MRLIRIAALSVVVLVGLVSIIGKGGGGAAAPAPPSDTVFLTTDPNFDEPGEFANFNLTGTATDLTGSGRVLPVTASINITRLPNRTIGGEEVKVTETVTVITFTSENLTVSTGTTTVQRLDDSLIGSTNLDGVICTPESNYQAIPKSVKIGQSGILGTTTCSDGSTDTATYLVESSSINNQWAAIREFATSTQSGRSDLVVELVSHVTPDGQTQAIQLFGGDSDISFELST
jgi:hypothetical protein